MTTHELMIFLELLNKLPKEKQVEFYYMLKGAAFIAEKSA